MNYHFGRFSILNKILMIYPMLVKMRKKSQFHTLLVEMLLNPMVGNLITYIKNVPIFYPMISLFKYSMRRNQSCTNMWKSTSKNFRKIPNDMNHSEIWKYQKNLIINQEKLSNFSASIQWDYFCPFKRIMYMYIH